MKLVDMIFEANVRYGKYGLLICEVAVLIFEVAFVV